MVSLPPSGIASRALTARLSRRILKLVGIDECRPDAAGKHGLHGDILGHDASDQISHAGDQRVDRNCLRLQWLAARKRQELMGQDRRARGCVHRRVHHPLQTLVAALRQPPLQCLQIAGDHRQQIVEVMCDAAGELADRLHLLRLPQAFLGGLLLGQVTRHLGEADQFPLFVVDRLDDDVRPEPAAVLAHAPAHTFELAGSRRGRDRACRQARCAGLPRYRSARCAGR